MQILFVVLLLIQMAVVHSINSWVDGGLLQTSRTQTLSIGVHCRIVWTLSGLPEQQHAIWILVRESLSTAHQSMIDRVQLRRVWNHLLMLRVVLIVRHSTRVSHLGLIGAGAREKVSGAMLCQEILSASSVIIKDFASDPVVIRAIDSRHGFDTRWCHSLTRWVILIPLILLLNGSHTAHDLLLLPLHLS